MVLFILVQIPIGSEYLKAGADASYLQALSNVFMQAQLDAYNLAMITLGVASLMLCYTLYRAKLVPRFLAVWGLVGYAIILCGSVLEVLGFGLLSIHAIPGPRSFPSLTAQSRARETR
jgi:steroid 5-alpha reductase family enzyme